MTHITVVAEAFMEATIFCMDMLKPISTSIILDIKKKKLRKINLVYIYSMDLYKKKLLSLFKIKRRELVSIENDWKGMDGRSNSYSNTLDDT